MKKRTILLSMALLIGAMFFSSVKGAKIKTKKFQYVQEISINLESSRTIAALSTQTGRNIVIDPIISDNNFPINHNVSGQTTLVLYKLNTLIVDAEDITALAEEEGLQYIDAQTLGVIMKDALFQLPKRHSLIAMNTPENLFQKRVRYFIFWKYNLVYIPYVVNSGKEKYEFNAGYIGFNCGGRGDYVIFIKPNISLAFKN